MLQKHCHSARQHRPAARQVPRRAPKIPHAPPLNLHAQGRIAFEVTIERVLERRKAHDSGALQAVGCCCAIWLPAVRSRQRCGARALRRPPACPALCARPAA